MEAFVCMHILSQALQVHIGSAHYFGAFQAQHVIDDCSADAQHENCSVAEHARESFAPGCSLALLLVAGLPV